MFVFDERGKPLFLEKYLAEHRTEAMKGEPFVPLQNDIKCPFSALYYVPSQTKRFF